MEGALMVCCSSATGWGRRNNCWWLSCLGDKIPVGHLRPFDPQAKNEKVVSGWWPCFVL